MEEGHSGRQWCTCSSLQLQPARNITPGLSLKYCRGNNKEGGKKPQLGARGGESEFPNTERKIRGTYRGRTRYATMVVG